MYLDDCLLPLSSIRRVVQTLRSLSSWSLLTSSTTKRSGTGIDSGEPGVRTGASLTWVGLCYFSFSFFITRSLDLSDGEDKLYLLVLSIKGRCWCGVKGVGRDMWFFPNRIILFFATVLFGFILSATLLVLHPSLSSIASDTAIESGAWSGNITSAASFTIINIKWHCNWERCVERQHYWCWILHYVVWAGIGAVGRDDSAGSRMVVAWGSRSRTR